MNSGIPQELWENIYGIKCWKVFGRKEFYAFSVNKNFFELQTAATVG